MASIPYNQLLESNDKNSNYVNNMNNNNKIYNNQNINMSGENNNNMMLEEDLIQNKNNPNANIISSGYNPKPLQTLKWRNIMKIDIDLIRNTRDLSLLNSNLENIIFSDITEDDIQSVPEENVIKLIKILQFLNEFLLEQRQMINSRLITLQQEGEKLVKNNQDLDVNLLKQKEHLNKYKIDAKERLKQITEYKNAINALLKQGNNNLRGKHIKITDINMDINNYGYNNKNIENNNYLKSGYKCKYCTGKIFPSEFELKKHYNDIHLISNYNDGPQILKAPKTKSQITMPIEVNLQPFNNINNNDNKDNLLLKEMNEMRFEFQNQIHQLEINKLKTQLMNQNNFNDKEENYKQQMEKMGKTFNDTLKHVLGLIKDNQPQKPKVVKHKNKEKIKKLDEEINSLKKELEETYLKNKELDSEIFKKRNEINELNIKKQEISIIKTKTNIIPKKTQLVPAQTTNLLYNKTNIRPKIKEKRFHSGAMMSDHDDSDRENKKKRKILDQMKEQTKLIELIIKKPSDDDFILNKPKKIILDSIMDDIDVPDDVNLDDFYKRYKARDNNFIKVPKFNNYKRVVPPNFNDDNKINNNAKKLMKEYIKNQANFFTKNVNDYKIPPYTEVKDLEKLDKGDLKQTVGILLKNLDNLNDEGEEEKHYKSLKKLLDFNQFKKFRKNDLRDDD